MYKELLILSVGIILGLVISRYLPAMVKISGKFKQKGRNTSNTISDIQTTLKTPKKEGRIKKFINKRKLKKEANEIK